MTNIYEETGMIVHKPNSTKEEYLIETLQWEKEIEQILKEPCYTVPRGLSKEQMREWLRKCEDGEIEADA